MTGGEIKQIRKDRDMNQQAFARFCRVSLSTICAYEQGRRNITPSMARKFRDASIKGAVRTFTVRSGESILIEGK